MQPQPRNFTTPSSFPTTSCHVCCLQFCQCPTHTPILNTYEWQSVDGVKHCQQHTRTC
ncbi:uncharacterized protein LACBIDRAFT_317709 [Laccaria bicolor S238N-H82]|uniref:Predicted protein n=1 Tax=Laccaria bicolor (strain S238N-H82 / ATCC MYA-4686) TaxID=486041 RepID=B0E285_LACBS|nr:uncharacterized protein LACBIDRAFT_317709 [Laccaria bicolor S238N-H82]EDQ99061.1 predicted protein [Laccaria bicolor S238N-H82]|eukprot:XP_001890304.1 predicted protein [Laccaria bicolor S238N-H82]